MKEFEEQIIKDFLAFGGYSSGQSPAAEWIKGHLREVQDYPLSMFRKYRDFCLAARNEKNAKIRCPRQSSFIAYLFMLRKMRLIQSVKPPYRWAPQKRHYLQLNPRNVDSDRWANPRLKMYPHSWKPSKKKLKSQQKRRGRKNLYSLSPS